MNSAGALDPDAALIQEQRTAPEQGTFDSYRAQLVTAARDQGQHGAQRGDPDGFDDAVTAIREALEECHEVTADDLVVIHDNQVGAAFSYLRKAGEIECCGYAVSRRPRAHGRLVRVWRAV